MTTPDDDARFMRAAIAISRRGQGATWPNPSVGCVIVRDGYIAGQGLTAPGGRPHAETRALAMAGAAAHGATAYVTLEPCAHHGQTPPCAQSLITAGIARVVVACRDPDPRVNGGGVAMLRAAGIAVTEDCLTAEATPVLAPFFMRVTQARPLVTLKLAATLDGRIATASGDSQWITSEAARRRVQALRGQHDAVMVGSGTALADDPDLTCRLPAYGARPTVRVVIDGGARLPLTHRLAQTARQAPTYVVHGPGIDPARHDALAQAGVRMLAAPRDASGIDLAVALALLAQQGLCAVLAEGGGRLAASLLRAGLVDRLAWFSAAALLGEDARAAVGPMAVASLPEMTRFSFDTTEKIGPDILHLLSLYQAR